MRETFKHYAPTIVLHGDIALKKAEAFSSTTESSKTFKDHFCQSLQVFEDPTYS